MDHIGIIILVVLIVFVGFIYDYHRNKQRRAAMEALAREMGFAFDPQKSRSLAKGFSFIKHMSKGHSHYAHNILRGHTPDMEPALIFDYRFTTGSGKSSQTHDYSIFTIKLPRRFPELQIEPEGFGSALKSAIGFDDIDFESLEFSQRYDIRSEDKKFAYDFCNARMIDYLLNRRNFVIEVDRCNLVLIFKERLSTSLCRANYHRMLEIRKLMPDYLFA